MWTIPLPPISSVANGGRYHATILLPRWIQFHFEMVDPKPYRVESAILAYLTN
jgi:hypothetical protein